jgi:hypothetical protein
MTVVVLVGAKVLNGTLAGIAPSVDSLTLQQIASISAHFACTLRPMIFGCRGMLDSILAHAISGLP